MSEAAPQAAGGTRTDETEQALSYLQLLWGDDHQIGHDEQGYWASPHGQIGRIIRAGSPMVPACHPGSSFLLAASLLGTPFPGRLSA